MGQDSRSAGRRFARSLLVIDEAAVGEVTVLTRR